MFYANNEQVKGIFLNGRNFNYLAYGFGKIIPEDRNAEQLNLNLAYKNLNQYRIEWGTIKDGYENALVSPRFDKPDSYGVFRTPFTYYYGGNIISTKQVPVLITNGNYALSNALVYNDMNINGAINYFAENTDFQGHNVNVYPERNDYQQYQALLNYEMLINCGNFNLNISTRFSKGMYPTLYNCNNFSGNFKYVGNQDSKYPGFRGFLEECKDGVFNIDCTNMHGGGSTANVTNYYNFSGIQGCNNIKLNITGSSWQVWPHDHSFSRNCNIKTYNVISGFSYMNDCNFDITLPKDSKPEMTSGFGFLNDAENCNYNLNALDVNLFNYRSGVGYKSFFDVLNNCNLNLLVNNTVSFDHTFGSKLNNCNIVFDNIKTSLAFSGGWLYLNNCKITGNIVNSAYADGAFIYNSNNINVNLNFAGTTFSTVLSGCSDIKGNIVCGDVTYVSYSNYLNLNVSNGNLELINVEHGRFNLNRTNAHCSNLNNIYAIADNTSFRFYYTNNTEIQSDGGNTSILGADNCYNLKLSGLTFKTPDSDSLFENVYNSDLKFGIANPYYRLWRVENCKIDGFPRGFAYVNNCLFRPFDIRQVGLCSSEVGTWDNLWPHNTTAGIRTRSNLAYCRIDTITFSNSGDISGRYNLQTSLENHYNRVTVITDNAKSILTISCNELHLGLQPIPTPSPMPFVDAGFIDSSISANNIFPLGDFGTFDAGAKVGLNTRIYCSGYCDTQFYSSRISFYSPMQPIVLLNSYRIMNRDMCRLPGGLYRFGTLSDASYLDINNGACVFINNIRLSNVNVDNALLFMGSNASVTGSVTVTNGGRVRNAANLTSDDIRFIDRGQLCWNVWDYGPWGSYRLIDFCTSV